MFFIIIYLCHGITRLIVRRYFHSWTLLNSYLIAGILVSFMLVLIITSYNTPNSFNTCTTYEQQQEFSADNLVAEGINSLEEWYGIDNEDNTDTLKKGSFISLINDQEFTEYNLYSDYNIIYKSTFLFLEMDLPPPVLTCS